ncbi:MAG: 50S ribosomal protein L22 [Bacteroidales bacterium]|nr:50S ribosomal protein L22 [Bacteroidales bacterium]
MGARKRLAAEARKEENRTKCVARLVNNTTSPRKARLIADMIRGKNVDYALNVLKYSKKESSAKMHTLLLSAIANWQAKNEDKRVEDSNLYIKEIFVDGGTIMKRLMTAPRGRAYQIKKRSNHITIVLDSKVVENVNQTEE